MVLEKLKDLLCRGFGFWVLDFGLWVLGFGFGGVIRSGVESRGKGSREMGYIVEWHVYKCMSI